MRKFMLLAIMAVIAFAMVGCGDKELNDDTYVDIFCDTYMMEDEAEVAGVLEGYNTTVEEFETYTEGLFADEERLEAVSTAIAEKDPFAGMAFGLMAAFGFAGDDEWDDWEDFGEDMEDWGEDLGEALGEGLGALTEGLEDLAEGIDEGLAGDEEVVEEEVAE
jgi:hypothetical protein